MYVIPVVGVSLSQFGRDFGAPRSGGRQHAGNDLFAPRGTPVVAAIGGTVVRAGNDGGNAGLRVWIQGDDGYAHFYAHLHGINAQQGQRVQAGQQIGTVGNTGNARNTPPHLHYSINHRVGPENPVGNPADIFRQRGVVPAGQSPQAAAQGHQGFGGIDPGLQAAWDADHQEARAQAEHQERVLQVMQAMQGEVMRQREAAMREMPLFSQVPQEAFQVQSFQDRLQRSGPGDMTPQVARSATPPRGRERRLESLVGTRLPAAEAARDRRRREEELLRGMRR